MNSPKIKTNKKFTYFVGIDVSRNELDFAIMKEAKLLFHREIPNEMGEICIFMHELKSLHRISITKTLFCMENTGFYGNHILNYLSRLKAYIVVERPLQMKNSLGFNRSKTDMLDAIRIAKYAERYARVLRLWTPKRLVIQKLKILMSLRVRMVKIRTIAQTPLKEQTGFIDLRISDLSIALSNRSLTAIATDIQEIDCTIDFLIDSDEHLRHLFELIISVPGIGRITAIMIIVSTNEFIDIKNPKKFACYAGVVPFIRESGTSKGKSKLSNIANKKIKSLLHKCAISAIQYDPEIKAYYHRKAIVEGKPKMAVINAVRNKLVLRVFACINQNRAFEHNYICKFSVRENAREEILE